MEKYELYYVNYETKNGTKKEFEKVTEDLNLWDIKPILGTVKEFIPKIVKTSGRNGKYYIHKCLIIIEPRDGSIVDFIYKTIEDNKQKEEM